MRVSSNLWPQILRLVDFRSLFSIHPSIHPFFGATNFGAAMHQMIPLLQLNKLPTAQLKGRDSLCKNSLKKDMKIHPMMTNLAKKKSCHFSALWILPQFTHPSISEGKRWKRVWNRTSKATRCWSRFLIWEKRLRFGDFDISDFLLERFLVNMWQFWCRTIVCNTYRWTMLKTLLHWLHSKGKAAVFVLGCVCVCVYFLFEGSDFGKKPGKHQ